MNLYKKKIERIKNMKGFVLKKDFNYGALSFLVLALFLAGGAILQLLLYPSMPHEALVLVSTATFTAAIVIALFPLWTLVMAIILILWVWVIGELSLYLYPITALSSLGLLISSSFQLVYHWDKVIILRLGKFQTVRGPGLFFLIPLIDRAAEFIDTRIRATDFSAEKTLTKDTVPVHVDALAFLSAINNDTLWVNLLCIILGTVITMVVQSSSAAMAMTLTMAYNGWLGVTAAAAMILGSNIGTTITAYLASIGTSTTAKRAAWAHIIFNVFGSVISLILFHPLLALVNWITPGNIYALSGTALSSQLPLFLAMFHTVFNVINTVIFFPFVNQYAKFIKRLVPAKAEYDEGTYHFKYIGGIFIDSPEIYMLAIRDEIKKMANLACNMLTRYRGMFNNPSANMESDIQAMKKDEEYADQMQEQLSDFCVHLLQDSQTPTNASSLNCLIRVMDELESVTDSCFNLTMLSQRRFAQGWVFDEETDKDLKAYQQIVQDFLDYIRDRMDKTLTKAEMQMANEYEEQINSYRNRLSETVQERLSGGKADVRVELLILEKIRHLEHIGDYCTNIAEAYHQAVKHTPMLQKRSDKSVSSL